jgi:hypothetical protein
MRQRRIGELDVDQTSEKSWKKWSVAGWTALAAVCCLAADDPYDPPVRGRPAAFSGIVGAVNITAIASPTEVQAESPINYKVRLQGPPSLATLAVPDLRKVRGFETRFAIRLLAERWLPKEKTREFEFELRPVNATVDAIPAFSFVYWVPGTIPPEAGYQTRYTQTISLKVTARPATSVQELPIEGAPETRSEQDLTFDFSAPLLEKPMQIWRPTLGQVAIVALVPPFLVWFHVRRRWRAQRWSGVECAQTLQLARGLAAVDAQLSDADERVRRILETNRGMLVEKSDKSLHGSQCRCGVLLGSGLAYLYGGARQELLGRLVQEARSFVAREEGAER